MRMLAYTALVAALVMFTGCSLVLPPGPAPRPPRQPAPQTAPKPQAKQPSPPATESGRPGNQAVLALLDRAQAQAASGQKEAAGASLERALRIEPGNPLLWQELARLRLSQGRYAQAENMAAKSNALAGGDQRLRAENWRIIGRARSKLGDEDGAAAAFRRAARE